MWGVGSGVMLLSLGGNGPVGAIVMGVGSTARAVSRVSIIAGSNIPAMVATAGGIGCRFRSATVNHTPGRVVAGHIGGSLRISFRGRNRRDSLVVRKFCSGASDTLLKVTRSKRCCCCVPSANRACSCMARLRRNTMRKRTLNNRRCTAVVP